VELKEEQFFLTGTLLLSFFMALLALLKPNKAEEEIQLFWHEKIKKLKYVNNGE
jgi:hypothetical protein